MKICTECCEQKEKGDFYKDAKMKDGRRTKCKACTSKYAAKYRSENQETIKRIRSNYYKENAETINAKNKSYAAANPDAVKAIGERYRKAHPEKSRVRCQNRRALKRENGGKLSKNIARRLIDLQKGRCPCCRKLLGDNYHLDHIMPIALGGTNTDDNIQLLRSECNQQKHAKHPIDFMNQRGFLL